MHGVHVFHEGLSVGGRAALKIAAEMAAQGNRSCRLALELVERGATLQQTEDAALLEERNALLRQALAAPRVENRVQARKRYEAQAQGLMAARDAYIAAQVDRLVGAEEAAVLFIGPDHLIEQVIAPDFGVTMLPSAPGHGA